MSKVGYNIPKGLASMERIDKILLAENTIKEPEHPKHLASFEHQIEFRDVSFRYGETWILRHINLIIPKVKERPSLSWASLVQVNRQWLI